MPRARDLFRQVPVTECEIVNWVRHIAPHLAHSQWRIAAYAKGYNVADKIRAAKLNGEAWAFDLVCSCKSRCILHQ